MGKCIGLGNVLRGSGYRETSDEEMVDGGRDQIPTHHTLLLLFFLF